MAKISDIPHCVANGAEVQRDTSIHVYESGTTTPVSLFSDEGLANAIGNPYVVPVGNPIPELYHGFAGEIRIQVIDALGTLLDDDPYDHPVSAAALASTGSDKGAALVGYAFDANAPFIRTQSALEKLREFGASIRDTGAVGTGLVDDSDALEEMLDYFKTRGGQWRIPPGVYKTTREIVVDCSQPQTIVGAGMRGVYPGAYTLDANRGQSVILPVHQNRNAFRFVGPAIGGGTIHIRNLALTTLETGTVPEAAFGWETNDRFLRDFTFDNCSIHGFDSAFDTYKTGGTNTEVGLFKAERCNINRNHWIARTLDSTQWNGFDFVANEAGQNGYLDCQGGIDVSAHNANILRNTLEGTRDPIRLSSSTRGVKVEGNYLEAVVGVAAIHLQNIRGHYDVGANAYLAIDYSKLKHTVLLTNCGAGRVLGPYWADGVYKTELPVLGNSLSGGDNLLNPSVDSTHHGILRMDSLDRGEYLREPEYSAIAKQRVTVDGRELAPWCGRPMPVQEYGSSNPGAISLNYAIAGSPGEWVVVSWLFRREPDAGDPKDPYVSLLVNGTGGAGSRDYIAYAFDENWRDGEWCLLTCAAKLGVAMTSLSINFFPHGVNPGSGRVTRFLRPVVYVTNDPNKIIPYVDDYTARSVTIAPDASGFEQGDTIFNANVAAAGQAEFVKLAGANNNWVYA
jgi:hypothetical protein